MRSAFVALVAVIGLTTLPVTTQAAPAVVHGLAVTTPAPELIRGGCGPGYHPREWRDRWGRWHRRCVPNRW